MSTGRFHRIVETLTHHQVRFIVVGGLSAVLNRVPVVTEDMDIVHDREAENVDRLLRALGELGALYRGDPRRLRPGPSHLA